MKTFILNSAISQALALLAAHLSLDAGQEFRLLTLCLGAWDMFLIIAWLIMKVKVRQIVGLKFIFSVWGAWFIAVSLSIAVTLILNARAGAYW